MCYYEGSISIDRNAVIHKCPWSIKSGVPCSECRYNLLQPNKNKENNIFIILSYNCNLDLSHCKYCQDKIHSKDDSNCLNEEIYNVIREYDNDKVFLFSHYEPLLKTNDIISIIDSIKNSSSVIETNGTIFDIELCKIINNTNTSIVFNYDTMDSGIIDKYIENVDIRKIKLNVLFCDDFKLNKIKEIDKFLVENIEFNNLNWNDNYLNILNSIHSNVENKYVKRAISKQIAKAYIGGLK